MIVEVFGAIAASIRADRGGGASCRLVMSALMTSPEPPAVKDTWMLGPQPYSFTCKNTFLQLKYFSPCIEVSLEYIF